MFQMEKRYDTVRMSEYDFVRRHPRGWCKQLYLHVCICICIRACERSVSGAENGAERVKNSWSGSGAVSGLLKKSRSVSGAWSGMNYPLKFRSNHLNFGLHKSQIAVTDVDINCIMSIIRYVGLFWIRYGYR